MSNIQHMNPEHEEYKPQEPSKWLDGELAPMSGGCLVRVVITINKTVPPTRYCFTNVTKESTLEDIKEILEDVPQIASYIDDPSTDIILQAREYVPGAYFDEWEQRYKIGRYTMWSTIWDTRYWGINNTRSKYPNL